MYSEGYSYDGTTGNLASKNGVNYTAYDANHKHAVTNLSNGNSYAYDANGNMTSRNVGGQSFTLNYDAENRLVSVTGAATADFDYDADGKQVKATVNGVTTYYIGNHYEVKSGVVTKYYFAGTTRLAVRTNGTLSYLLGDHIGSSSVTTDANGVQTATALYKAFGETRYTLGNLGTDYQFTGQRLQAELGIYWFQSRWMDPSLGRFTQPDTIVPTSTQGTQAWDRYAFVNNNPVRYNDPTGHMGCDPEDDTCKDELEEVIQEDPDQQQAEKIVVGDDNLGYTYDPVSGTLIIYKDGESRTFNRSQLVGKDKDNIEDFMDSVDGYYVAEKSRNTHLGYTALATGLAVLSAIAIIPTGGWGIIGYLGFGATAIYEAGLANDDHYTMSQMDMDAASYWNAVP